MKTMSFGKTRMMTVAVTLAILASVPQFAFSRMDSEVHTIVIDKLEKSLREAKQDETLVLAPVRARLADLYSDRARLRAMEEVERNCSDCKGAEADRKRALELYGVVVRESDQSRRGAILVQMAHLHSLTGNKKKAEDIHERLINEGVKLHAPEHVAAGYAGRGETRFAKADFERAEKDFESAMKLAPEGRRGALLHRIAWAQLNQGEQKKAVKSLIRLLETPELLSRETTQGNEFESSFHEDVARDLATFMARGSISSKDIKTLEDLTPDQGKKENMKYFAEETERLGQKRSAIEAWGVFVSYETNTLEQLEAKVRVARIRYDLGDKADALKDMRDAIQFWNKNGCDKADKCDQFQARLRKIVTDWNKSEQKNPTPLLFDAYLVYLGKFQDDVEMSQWAAEIANDLKRYKEAAALYHKTSLLAASKVGSFKDASKEKTVKAILESSLVGYIEMAELTKDKDLREASYDHYLKLNSKGAMATKVRYQRAHIAYERGNSREASKRFNAFVAGEDCRKPSDTVEKLCIQAADLDLDSLVLLKDDELVEKRALAYSKQLPERKPEYLKIYRTSVLKQAEKMSPKAAISKLSGADMTGASDEDQIKFYKFRLSAAEKARDLSETRRAATLLLSVRSLSEKDQEFVLGKKAWAAEMEFNFAEAYEVTRKMRLASLKEEDRIMRLAILAEMAGKDPRRHEREFLQVSRDGARNAAVRAKLVRSSSDPMKEMRKHESFLKEFPQIYAPLALELFARTGDTKFAERALRVRGVNKEPAGQVISRHLFLRDFAKLDDQLAKHKINARSEGLMQKTLAARLQLLADAERAGNNAISTRDLTLQIVTLSTLSRENERLYKDIVSLPVPAKLRGSQRDNYKKMVEAQARQYLAKHDQIEKKLSALWSNSDSTKVPVAELQLARPELRPIFAREIRALAQVAPSGKRSSLERELRNSPEVPSPQTVASVQREVKSQPFSASVLQRLRKLEERRGRETVVAYLDARLTKLNEGEKKQ